MAETDRWRTVTDNGPKVDQPSVNAAFQRALDDSFAGKALTHIYLDEGNGWTLYTTYDHNR
jgi:hypothetical protein